MTIDNSRVRGYRMDTAPWIPCFAVTSAVTASSVTALFRGNPAW